MSNGCYWTVPAAHVSFTTLLRSSISVLLVPTNTILLSSDKWGEGAGKGTDQIGKSLFTSHSHNCKNGPWGSHLIIGSYVDHMLEVSYMIQSLLFSLLEKVKNAGNLTSAFSKGVLGISDWELVSIYRSSLCVTLSKSKEYLRVTEPDSCGDNQLTAITLHQSHVCGPLHWILPSVS